MRKGIFIIAMLVAVLQATARHRIYHPQVKSLQVIVNQEWLNLPVMRLGTDDVLNVAFDEMSHQYHRYIYTLEHCEADWSKSEDIFESDWLEGFNGNPIDDYQNSVNTILPYTHYKLQIPNDRCRLKLSGNYRLIITDDEDENMPVLTAEFYVTEQLMSLSLSGSTNTDIDTNQSHQQLSMNLGYGTARVTNPKDQIKTIVMQNGIPMRYNAMPNFQNANGLEWKHNKQLIFDGGNEYRKFEILDVSHPTMGIDIIRWDGANYQVYPFLDETRPYYIFDKDANGAFLIRNSDNLDIETTSEYVWVNFRLKAPRQATGHIILDGQWATSDNIYDYIMTYDDIENLYTAKILQKQGYYSYQYLWLDDDESRHLLPLEGNFYQTENQYQVFAYFRGTGERTWRLVAYHQLDFQF